MKKMSKTLLWLDDIRNPNTENWLDYSPIEKPFKTIWVKNYNDFVEWIEQNGLPTAICFDHDLEPDIINGDPMKPWECTIEYAKTGFDCTKWLVDYCMDNNFNACQTKVIKYISRYSLKWKDKKRQIEDLEKGKHVIDMLIEKIKDK